MATSNARKPIRAKRSHRFGRWFCHHVRREQMDILITVIHSTNHRSQIRRTETFACDYYPKFQLVDIGWEIKSVYFSVGIFRDKTCNHDPGAQPKSTRDTFCCFPNTSGNFETVALASWRLGEQYPSRLASREAKSSKPFHPRGVFAMINTSSLFV